MFSNKFDVGIVYVFKVGIIRIILKILLIRSSFFFQIYNPKFLASFLLFSFFLEFTFFFPFFSQQDLQSLKYSIPKKHVGWGEGGN
jgi:hypothetical protein